MRVTTTFKAARLVVIGELEEWLDAAAEQLSATRALCDMFNEEHKFMQATRIGLSAVSATSTVLSVFSLALSETPVGAPLLISSAAIGGGSAILQVTIDVAEAEKCMLQIKRLDAEKILTIIGAEEELKGKVIKLLIAYPNRLELLIDGLPLVAAGEKLLLSHSTVAKILVNAHNNARLNALNGVAAAKNGVRAVKSTSTVTYRAMTTVEAAADLALKGADDLTKPFKKAFGWAMVGIGFLTDVYSILDSIGSLRRRRSESSVAIELTQFASSFELMIAQMKVIVEELRRLTLSESCLPPAPPTFVFADVCEPTELVHANLWIPRPWQVKRSGYKIRLKTNDESLGGANREDEFYHFSDFARLASRLQCYPQLNVPFFPGYTQRQIETKLAVKMQRVREYIVYRLNGWLACALCDPAIRQHEEFRRFLSSIESFRRHDKAHPIAQVKLCVSQLVGSKIDCTE